MTHYRSMMDLLRLIETPKPGESAEGCRMIWLCVDCYEIHYDTAPEKCSQCEEEVYPYVQGDTYAALAKNFLELAAERDRIYDRLLKCSTEKPE